ncbi:MAG TPA: heparinase II/III family protein [Trueperaceae bacterium]
MTTSIVLSAAEEARLLEQLGRHAWYRQAFERFRSRVDELIERSPRIPIAKGRAFYESCPDDNARLLFDPYAPHSHLCPKCGRNWTGEAFDLSWVRQFQEWLGKRLVEAGIVYRLVGEERYALLVRDSLAHFIANYRHYPLANNLLGPTRLFQSTYLEAFWLVDAVAAYDLTRSSGVYSQADHSGIRELFYESASIVRSYDEGVSNRQAFNNAGMGAVALLYEDDELLTHVLRGPHGFAFHMRESLLEDGIWYEGETYHFATLDHTLDLAEMARHRGIDLYSGGTGLGSLRPMFDGPLQVMLPDLTFPSRKDSWFGRGIGYHKEIYELGYARYGDERYGGLLAQAYSSGRVDRADMSWRTFLHLEPELPEVRLRDLRPKGCEPMPGTGVAILRRDDGGTYASLEYGHYGGGHGHPDRLHLTLFADGAHWLLDPGTGWYHVPELGWYRSTVAHNTLSVDGRLQVPREGELVAFGDAGGYQVAQTRVAGIADGVQARRTLCLGEGFLLDVVDAWAEDERLFDLSLHTPAVPGEVRPRGSAQRLGARDGYEFLGEAHQMSRPLDIDLLAGDSSLRLVQDADALHYLSKAPGIPLREEEPLTSLISRAKGKRIRFASAYLWGPARHEYGLRVEEDELLLESDDLTHRLLVSRGNDGVAVSCTRHHSLHCLAWFGSRSFRLSGVSIESDLALEAAALVRAGASGWGVELPESFGQVTVRGLEAGAVAELCLTPKLGTVSSRSGGELRLTQKSGTLIWREGERPLHLFAGVGNGLTVNLKSYDGEPDRPVLELPDGWQASGPRDLGSGRWQWSVRAPLVTGETGGELVVRAGAEALSLPYTVQAPISTCWLVVSAGGEPQLVLEVRDLSGRSHRLAAGLRTPWSNERFELELPADGMVRLPLPLPVWAPEPVEGDASTDGTPLVSGSAWRLPGLEDRSGAYSADAELTLYSVADEPRTDPGDVDWPPESSPGAAGESALHQPGGAPAFVGITRANLPLYWSERTAEGVRLGGSEPIAEGASPGAGEQALLCLGHDDQALWSDRRWRGPDDASARASLRWSAEGLRLECLVRDDLHVTDGNVDDAYENDSLQVYFDFREDHHGDRNFGPGVAAYVLAPASDRREVRVLPIAGNREISNRGARAAWFSTDGVEATCEPTDEGYLVRAFFPFASLGTSPLRPGDVIGFDLALSDNDGTWYRNTQLLWSGARGRRCYIRGSYHDPREFGWLIVAGG